MFKLQAKSLLIHIFYYIRQTNIYILISYTKRQITRFVPKI